MKKRKPHNLRARIERSCRAILSTNHVCVVNIDPAGHQQMFNWKSVKRITSRQVLDAIFDVPHNWTIYISGMCIDQTGVEYLKSVEIAPVGLHLASQLTEAIEHHYTELRDSCNPKHLVAYGWIAIPSDVSLDAIDRAADELEEMGYQTKALLLSASDMGADHVRERYWLLAYADSDGELLQPIDAEMAQLQKLRCGVWEAEPRESRMVNGMAHRMERIATTGNGQVPIVAAAAFAILINNI